MIKVSVLPLLLLCFGQWGSCVVDPYPAPQAVYCNPINPIPPLAATVDAITNITMKINTEKVVAQLVAKVAAAGFATASYGSGASAIYGLLQCRADVPSSVCSECIKLAQTELNSRCAKDGKARLWFSNCYLRLGTFDFVGKLDRMDYYVTDNSGGDVLKPKVFQEKVAELMKEVTAMAIVPGQRSLGTGKVKVSHKMSIYGLAQCTRDLAPSVCSGCLATAVSKFGECCVGKENGLVLFGSCSVGYQLFPFFYVPN